MKRIAVTALVAAALIAGGAPAWASVARTAKAPKLGALLLGIDQMPTGWSVVNSSGSGGVGCLANTLEPKGLKQMASASTAFADNGNVPEVSEKLATYSVKASTAFGKIVSALDTCKHVSGKANGAKATGTIGQMSFPRYGDQSAAFNVNLTVQGANLGEDVLIVKKGTIIMGILEGDIGSPNLGQFEGFVKKALAELPGPTATSKRSTTKPTAATSSTSGIGKVAKDGEFAFVVKSVQCGATAAAAVAGSGGFGETVPAGAQECLVTMTVTDDKGTAQTYFASNQYAYDGKIQFSADSNATFYLSGANDDTQVNPGITITAIVPFQIPSKDTLTTLSLHDSAFSGGVTVRL